MKATLNSANKKPKRSSLALSRKKDPRLRKGYKEVQLELSLQVNVTHRH
jgi:hypothetical protein